jgi:hypothetical protein
VQSIEVVVRTSTQLVVTVTPPSLFQYPWVMTTYFVASYVLSWGTGSAATGLGEMAINMTSPAQTTSMTISSLITNVPVFVRVSVSVRIVTSQETLWCVGPFVTHSEGVAPLPPILTSVSLSASSGQLMSTRGGEDMILYGTDIGIFSPDLAVSYSNGPITLTASNCRIVSPGKMVTCSTTEGVGSRFAWRVIVGASFGAAPTLTSYDLPVIRDFSGPGAIGAVTSGGQQVIINGNMFGPTGTMYITRDSTHRRGTGFFSTRLVAQFPCRILKYCATPVLGQACG